MTLDNSLKIPSKNEADARTLNGGGGGTGEGWSEHGSLDWQLGLLFAMMPQQIQNVEGPRCA